MLLVFISKTTLERYQFQKYEKQFYILHIGLSFFELVLFEIKE